MILAIVTKLALCLVAGLLWWIGNIQYGNLKAMEYMGWLASYPWWVQWVAGLGPSISQLYITERWKHEQLDPLSMVFAAFVAIVIDLGGPVLGFFVVTGLPVNAWTIAGAIVLAAFSSILCQHVAWVQGKSAIEMILSASAKPRAKARQERKPTRLIEKMKVQHVQHPNGREKAHASPPKDE